MYVIVLFAKRETPIIKFAKCQNNPDFGQGQGGGVIMIDKTKIKIVKRSEAVALKSKVKKAPTSRAKAREMVSTVTDWVSDIKQRKSDETKAAFDLLFAANQQPSES
jgi:hypothetical protein